MVVLDFLTAGLILAFILLSGKTDILPLVIAVMMALYAIQGAYNPAVQASIPLLLGGDDVVNSKRRHQPGFVVFGAARKNDV